MQQLTKRQDLELGEFIAIKEYLNEPNRFLPLAIRLVESDWLDESIMTPRNGETNEVEQGVEYNATTGRVVGYHFADPTGYMTKRFWVDADRVIHGFQTLRPMQMRGISQFVCGVLMSGTFHEILSNEIVVKPERFFTTLKTFEIFQDIIVPDFKQ